MKARITVGPVHLRTEGMTLTVREIRGLMRYATEIALAVLEAASDEKDEPDANPIGFTAIIERALDNDDDVLD